MTLNLTVIGPEGAPPLVLSNALGTSSQMWDLQLDAFSRRFAVVRYEHAAPGDLIHIDTKKLGRIEKLGHRITGNPQDETRGDGDRAEWVIPTL